MKYSSLAKRINNNFSLYDEYTKFISATINSGIPIPYEPPLPPPTSEFNYPFNHFAKSDITDSNINSNPDPNPNSNTDPNPNPIINPDPNKKSKQVTFSKQDWFNEKTNCECGGIYTNKNKQRHVNTTGHLDYFKVNIAEENTDDEEGEDDYIGPPRKRVKSGSIVVESDEDEEANPNPNPVPISNTNINLNPNHNPSPNPNTIPIPNPNPDPNPNLSPLTSVIIDLTQDSSDSPLHKSCAVFMLPTGEYYFPDSSDDDDELGK